MAVPKNNRPSLTANLFSDWRPNFFLYFLRLSSLLPIATKKLNLKNNIVIRHTHVTGDKEFHESAFAASREVFLRPRRVADNRARSRRWTTELVHILMQIELL